MGIPDIKLLFCHGISELIRDKKISRMDYNNRPVYDCFNDPFTDDCSHPDLNLSYMPLDDSTNPNKISLYTPDLIPAAIYVSYQNYVFTLNNPFEPPKFTLLDYDCSTTEHIIMVDKHESGNVKIGYRARRHDGIILHQKS